MLAIWMPETQPDVSWTEVNFVFQQQNAMTVQTMAFELLAITP